MRRILLFRLGSRDVHLPKLLGAFLLIGSGLMLIHAFTGMFDSWENVKAVHACIDAANTQTVSIQDCQTSAFQSLGITFRANQYRLTDLQVATALLPKIAHVFFWVAGLIIGLVFYRSARMVVPIEESMNDLRRAKWKKRR